MNISKNQKKFFLIAAFAVLIDQIVKVIIKLNMQLGQEFSVFGDLFKIHFTENMGAAFGLTLANFFPFLSETSAKVILTLFSFFAVFFIVYILIKTSHLKSGLPFFLALILGGAMGNIIDRMFYGVIFSHMNNYEGGLLFGRVVDMFYLDIWKGYVPEWVPFIGGGWYALWPIWNVADACISVGIVSILIFQRKFFNMDLSQLKNEVAIPKEKEDPPPPEEKKIVVDM